jgi:hypothetical protein
LSKSRPPLHIASLSLRIERLAFGDRLVRAEQFGL